MLKEKGENNFIILCINIMFYISNTLCVTADIFQGGIYFFNEDKERGYFERCS